MTNPPDNARLVGQAKTFDGYMQRRRAEAQSILDGRFPPLEDVLVGLPPFRGSYVLDMQAFAVDMCASTTLPDALRKVLEPLAKVVGLNTIGRTIDLVKTQSQLFSGDPPWLRIVWYAALFGRQDAIDRLAHEFGFICSSRIAIYDDFYQRAYLHALSMGGIVPLTDVDRQAELIERGLRIMQQRHKDDSDVLPFALDASLAPRLLAEADQEAADKAADDAGVARLDRLAGMRAEPELDLLEIDDIEFAEDGDGQGHQVLADLEDDRPASSERHAMHKSFNRVAGKVLPLARVPDRTIRQRLLQDFPHAAAAIDEILRGVYVGDAVRLEPTVLIGAPGSGKTSLLTAVAAALRLPHVIYSCSASSDNSFGGTPSRWHSAGPSVPLDLIRRSTCPNPVVILDELDKGGSSSAGSLKQALLPFLEPHTAKSFFEVGLDTTADLSRVSYLATANAPLPAGPLADRFRTVRMPDPGPEHVGEIASRIVDDLARRQRLPIAPIAPDELDIIREAWGGGSLRRLRRTVETLIETRDRLAPRQ